MTTKTKQRKFSRRVITLTEPLARAIAQDAANRNMRERIRHSLEPAVWNEDDYNVACDTLERIWFQPMKADFERRLAEGLVA